MITHKQVYGRIREAMEVAEGARLARDSAASRQRELEREVESLQARLVATRQVRVCVWGGRRESLTVCLWCPHVTGVSPEQGSWALCGVFCGAHTLRLPHPSVLLDVLRIGNVPVMWVWGNLRMADVQV